MILDHFAWKCGLDVDWFRSKPYCYRNFSDSGQVTCVAASDQMVQKRQSDDAASIERNLLAVQVVFVKRDLVSLSTENLQCFSSYQYSIEKI